MQESLLPPYPIPLYRWLAQQLVGIACTWREEAWKDMYARRIQQALDSALPAGTKLDPAEQLDWREFRNGAFDSAKFSGILIFRGEYGGLPYTATVEPDLANCVSIEVSYGRSFKGGNPIEAELLRILWQPVIRRAGDTPKLDEYLCAGKFLANACRVHPQS